MTPEQWGPHFWATLHIAALNNSDRFKDYVDLLPHLLPCAICSNDFYKIINKYPVRGDYFKWSVDVHNEVNRKLGKRQVGYDEARKRWTHGQQIPWLWITLALLLLVLVVLRLR
jgi:hypothetical protein